MKTFLTIALFRRAPPDHQRAGSTSEAPAQPTAAPTQEIASAWAAYAQGRLDDAVRALGPLTGSVEVGHDAADLLIRIEAGRDQIKPALSAYEGWLRQSRRDDRFLLYPVAVRILTTLGGSSDAAIKGAALARLAAAGLGPGATDTSGAALAERAGAGDKVAQQQLAEMMTSDPAFVRAGMVKALAAGGGRPSNRW